MKYRSTRRTFLKATGITLALPAMESLGGAAETKVAVTPRRMVCIGNEFGMYPEKFWPKTFGHDYEMTPSLKPLTEHRNDFTLFSNLDHGLKGGHFAIHGYLTATKSAEARGMPDGGISLDQRAAEFVGSQTRFPTIGVGSDDGVHGGCKMSWTRTGTSVPPVPGPRELFRMLFIDEDKHARSKATDRIALQGSILDAVNDDAKDLRRKLNPNDKRKLDEYFASVRDVENKLQLDLQWQNVPKPKATMEEPTNEGLTKDLPKIYDLLALAFQTDSTRVATLEIGKSFAVRDLGIRKGYHALSHHGRVEENIDLLTQIELYQVEHFARFLAKLKSIQEPNTDGTLLDRTMAMFGSGMGNANSHTNNNLPIILAGGGFKHGDFKQLPAEKNKRVPLSNLFVSMLQQFGVETEHFGRSTGTLTGLETT